MFYGADNIEGASEQVVDFFYFSFAQQVADTCGADSIAVDGEHGVDACGKSASLCFSQQKIGIAAAAFTEVPVFTNGYTADLA